MKIIASENNKLIKKIFNLFNIKNSSKKKYFITLGIKLTLETMRYFNCEYLLSYQKEILEKIKHDKKILITPKIFKKFMKLNNNPIIGIFKKKKHDNLKLLSNKILVLDDIQDPNNLGIILRNAGAFNIKTILMTKKCVDFYNIKVLSILTNPYIITRIFVLERNKIIMLLKKNKFEIVTTSLTLKNTFIGGNKFAIIIGNEGHGNHEEFIKNSDKNIKIKISTKYNSLNVASAATIILFKFMVSN